MPTAPGPTAPGPTAPGPTAPGLTEQGPDTRRIALVTGAHGGMGRACTRRLGRDHALLLTDLDQQRLDDEAAALRDAGHVVIAAIACDLRDPAAIDRLVATAAAAGAFRTLVHTAGLSPSMADWRTIFDVNLAVTERLSRAVLAGAAPGIVTVLITSIAAINVPKDVPDLEDTLDHPLAADFLDRLAPYAAESEKTLPAPFFAYSASKYGVVRHIHRNVRDYAARGGRIAGISPGIIDTPMGRLETRPGTPAAPMMDAVPLRRYGRPEEIAALAAFLASDDAGFATGCDWTLDGGLTAGTPHP